MLLLCVPPVAASHRPCAAALIRPARTPASRGYAPGRARAPPRAPRRRPRLDPAGPRFTLSPVSPAGPSPSYTPARAVPLIRRSRPLPAAPSSPLPRPPFVDPSPTSFASFRCVPAAGPCCLASPARLGNSSSPTPRPAPPMRPSCRSRLPSCLRSQPLPSSPWFPLQLAAPSSPCVLGRLCVCPLPTRTCRVPQLGRSLARVRRMPQLGCSLARARRMSQLGRSVRLRPRQPPAPSA